MTVLETINAWVVGIGIPAIIGAALYLGRKLQILDDLTGVRDRFAVVESRVGDMWADRAAPAHSPRKLNAYGIKILNESGIKEIIDEKKSTLLDIVKKKDIKNAYDAEQAVLLTVEKLPEHCPDIVDKLKNGAFKTGANLDTVLLVGGIYLRDLIFPDLGFSVDEIDKIAQKPA